MVFNVKTVKGLTKTRKWLETEKSDELMLGNPTGDSFNMQVESVRRGMLLKDIDTEMKKADVFGEDVYGSVNYIKNKYRIL